MVTYYNNAMFPMRKAFGFPVRTASGFIVRIAFGHT